MFKSKMFCFTDLRYTKFNYIIVPYFVERNNFNENENYANLYPSSILLRLTLSHSWRTQNNSKKEVINKVLIYKKLFRFFVMLQGRPQESSGKRLFWQKRV